MPQIKRDAVHRYFQFNVTGNYTVCKLCDNKMKGKHTSNLKNHLAVKHVNEYRVIVELNKDIYKTHSRTSTGANKSKSNSRNSTGANKSADTAAISKNIFKTKSSNSTGANKFAATATINDDIYKTKSHTPTDANKTADPATIETLQTLCLKLVAVHGRPFSMIEDEAFQEIINLALPSYGESKNINIKSIRAVIPEAAHGIREKICADIKNQMISLKLDSVTCSDRNFVGINIQYIKNAKIVIRNLAVIEINQCQTSEYLKYIVSQTLNEFRISKHQLYSLCTDNGKNIIKMTKLVGDDCSSDYKVINDEETNEPIVENEDEWNNNDDDYHVLIVQELDERSGSGNFYLNLIDRKSDNDLQTSNYSEEDIFTTDLVNVQHFIDLDSDIPFTIRGMLCAAHTLQLAVKDALMRDAEVQATIDLTRKVMKILRKPTNKIRLKQANLNKPIIDCPTRWISTYNMLVRLLTFRLICEEMEEISEVISNDHFWREVENLIKCLEPANDTTIILQDEQLTIGDFFITWLKCKNKLQSIDHTFATCLYFAMETREQNFLQNYVVLEALFLDSRINVMLTQKQCAKARSLLMCTYKQIQRVHILHDSTAPQSDDLSLSQNCNETPSTNASNDNTLEEILSNAERSRGIIPRQANSFEMSLCELVNTPRIPIQENIIQYWCNQSEKNSEVARVANVVLAAPSTQVSIERLYSSLKFILNPSRNNLNSTLLRDLILIRSNQDLI